MKNRFSIKERLILVFQCAGIYVLYAMARLMHRGEVEIPVQLLVIIMLSFFMGYMVQLIKDTF